MADERIMPAWNPIEASLPGCSISAVLARRYTSAGTPSTKAVTMRERIANHAGVNSGFRCWGR